MRYFLQGGKQRPGQLRMVQPYPADQRENSPTPDSGIFRLCAITAATPRAWPIAPPPPCIRRRMASPCTMPTSASVAAPASWRAPTAVIYFNGELPHKRVRKDKEPAIPGCTSTGPEVAEKSGTPIPPTTPRARKPMPASGPRESWKSAPSAITAWPREKPRLVSRLARPMPGFSVIGTIPAARFPRLSRSTLPAF